MSTPKADVVVGMTDQDMATTLFALRYLQANIDDARDLMRGSEHFIDVKPLDSRGIDYLCQRLNTKYMNISAADVDMCMNLAVTVLMEAPTDRRIMGILERFDIGPSDARILQTTLECALRIGDFEEGADHGRGA